MAWRLLSTADFPLQKRSASRQTGPAWNAPKRRNADRCPQGQCSSAASEVAAVSPELAWIWSRALATWPNGWLRASEDNASRGCQRGS
jgi:hypothetical protein